MVLRRVIFGVVFAGVGVGCSDDPPGTVEEKDNGTIDTPNIEAEGEAEAEAEAEAEGEDGPPTLSIIGTADVTLETEESATLRVRYRDGNGDPLPGTITFAFVGDANDSTLDDTTVLTNSTGTATAVLRAGLEAAVFEVKASAPLAEPVQFSIVVSLPPWEVEGGYGVVSFLTMDGDYVGTSSLTETTNLLYDLTDDPNDPATYLLDRILGGIDDPTMETLLSILRPGLDATLNEALFAISPDLIDQLLVLAEQLAVLTRAFELGSEFGVAQNEVSGEVFTATYSLAHTLKEIAWTVDGTRYGYTFESLDVEEPTAVVQVDIVDQETITIPSHTLAFPMGPFLNAVVNEAIVPSIDPSATDLDDLLLNLFNCDSIASSVTGSTGGAFDDVIEVACTVVVAGIAAVIEGAIVTSDSAGTYLTLAGDAALLDRTGDNRIDAMTNGSWTGSFTLDGATAPIDGADDTFSAER